MERGEEREGDVEATGTTACPECDGAVETVQHKDVFSYGEGESVVEIPVVLPVRHCRECGLEFLDHEAERIKHEALCRHFGVLTPWEIRDIRERSGLNQSAFAKLTGLGSATLSRWETGTMIQTVANDRYLRVLAAPGGMALLRSVERELGDSERHGAGEPPRPRFRCLVADEKIERDARSFHLFKEAA